MNVRSVMLVVAAITVVAGGVLAASRQAASEREPTEVRTVTVTNECPHPVWLFYGPNDPVPVDAVSLGADGSSAQPMLEGDVVWLLDQDREPLDRTAVAASTTAVTIDASCRSIRADR